MVSGMFKFYSSKLREVYLFLRFLKFAKISSNTNILIYGISRGGTTMLAESLVALFSARLIWEPLFPHKNAPLSGVNPFSVKSYAKLKLGWTPHSPTDTDKELNTYFDRLFALKIKNIRYFRFTNYSKFEKSEHTVFKFCFANFMYPYFQKRYGFKSIVLVRHPFAIAASSLNFGVNFDWHKENYRNWSYADTPKSGHFFKQYDDKYTLIVSPFTLLVFQVVSQYAYILEQLENTNTLVVFYEDLVLYPKNVLVDFEQFFECTFDENLFLGLLKKGSFSSEKGHTSKNAKAQLSKWKEKIDDEDINDALRIFKAFNFNIYSDDVLPLKSNFKI